MEGERRREERAGREVREDERVFLYFVFCFALGGVSGVAATKEIDKKKGKTHPLFFYFFSNTNISKINRAFLEKRYAEDMGIEDAIHTALLTLKEGFEGQVSGDNVEVAVVGTGGDRSFRVLTPSEVNDYLAEVD